MNIIGIDTGASYTRLWDGRHTVRTVATSHHYAQYLQLLTTQLKEYQPLQTLVIGLPAVIENSRVVKAPNLNADWQDQNIKADVRELLQMRGDIFILQDTEVAGYAVLAKELDDFDPTMMITLSTGVGGALIQRSGVLPLEVGHMPLDLSGQHRLCGCGQYGCVEADLSGTAIAKRQGMRAEAVEDGGFWKVYGEELGQFFLVLATLFKLKQILLFGGVSRSYHLFLPHAKRYIAARLKNQPVPEIRLSKLGQEAGVYGAYYYAVQCTEAVS